MRRVALDTNLLLLWVVGNVSFDWLRDHKRLSAFGPDDWRLLAAHIKGADLLTTPNAMTEASNLIVHGVKEPRRSGLLVALALFADEVEERYAASEAVGGLPEYARLGLADAAWLALLDRQAELLTDDLPLSLAALARGIRATNFNHLREGRG